MPQIPVSMTAARAEKLFAIRITDAPMPRLTAAEVNAQEARPWWSRRLRFGWRKNLAALALPAPKN
jgi:hypothetical protein